MRKTAGLLVMYQGAILLVQQRHDNNKSRLSIPKGGIIQGEDSLNAAIRETWEETGIYVPIININPKPYILNINSKQLQRRIIYYIATFPDSYELPTINVRDNKEIVWAGFVSYTAAFNCIQQTQLPLLFHFDEKRIHPHILNFLLDNKYISKAQHPNGKIYLYNYTEKCKSEEFWNEVTLWCRGLILDSQNTILYHPFKKFFEYEQLYTEFIPQCNIQKIYEKKDGFLGIMYWIGGCPYIATRDSFISYPAIKANIIFYTIYPHALQHLNPQYTYLFEIVFPNNYLIIDYGAIEDLFLIGIYDNADNKEVSLDEIELPFPQVRTFNLNQTLPELLNNNIINEEGYVLLYSDGSRLKIKFPDYKKKYKLKHEVY